MFISARDRVIALGHGLGLSVSPILGNTGYVVSLIHHTCSKILKCFLFLSHMQILGPLLAKQDAAHTQNHSPAHGAGTRHTAARPSTSCRRCAPPSGSTRCSLTTRSFAQRSARAGHATQNRPSVCPRGCLRKAWRCPLASSGHALRPGERAADRHSKRKKERQPTQGRDGRPLERRESPSSRMFIFCLAIARTPGLPRRSLGLARRQPGHVLRSHARPGWPCLITAGRVPHRGPRPARTTILASDLGRGHAGRARR